MKLSENGKRYIRYYYLFVFSFILLVISAIGAIVLFNVSSHQHEYVYTTILALYLLSSLIAILSGSLTFKYKARLSEAELQAIREGQDLME